MSGTGYKGPAAFRDFVEEVADGYLMADSSRELLRLIGECHERAVTENKLGKGKLTLELAIAVDPRGEIDVQYAHKVKTPARATARGRLWIDRDGNPTAVHPKQLEIPGAERKRRAEPPPETGRRAPADAAPEDAPDDGDHDGLA